MPSRRRLPLPRSLRRARRRIGRMIRPQRSRVVYHERYNLALPGVPNDPLRAERILAFLGAEGLLSRRALRLARPASLKSLARVHSAEYLDRVHDPEALERIFGSPVSPGLVDRLLDHQRLQTGGTKLATHLALRDRSLTVNLGGGLHHAHHDGGGGFCIFNDVAAAIAEARVRGLRGTVLVVDLDLHDGDGTRDLFRRDPTVHTYSVHARTWDEDPEAAVASTSIALGEGVDDHAYLAAVRDSLAEAFRAVEPVLVIYLAGTDVAWDDPLGDWQITAGGILERDRLVLGLARDRDRPLPLVILLAGGYGPESWRYSARFLAQALGGHGIAEPPSTEAITLERYRQIAALVGPVELSGGDPDNEFGLSEEDLFLPGWGMSRETRFLGYYTKHGIELVLERGGFFDRLRALGFDPVLELDLADESGHTLRIWGDAARDELLVELTASRDRRSVAGLELLAIAWLLMQNPRAEFAPNRPRLPGQQHPGLGMAHDVVALLILACERVHLDGLLWVPSYLHTAFPWRDRLVPAEPAMSVLWQALLALFDGASLADASRALADGEVVDSEKSEPIAWRPTPMVLPVSAAARTWAAKRRADPAGAPPRLRWRRGSG